MSERLSLNIGIAAALIISIGLVALAEKAAAQTACPAGTVAITSATRAAATAAGLPAAVSCWNPSDPSTGAAAGDAKLWLEQHATKNANVACLNSTFAEDLEKLMQAVPGGPPTITDAYRSPQTQAALPAGSTQVGACGSYHQYGLAADFNNASSQTLLWMRQNAPSYGLTPIPSLNVQTGCSKVSSFCDPGHIQIQGPLPPRNQCGVCNSSGSGTLPASGPAPSAVPDDTQYIPTSSTSQLPAGYCLVSTQPLIAMPCNTSTSLTPFTQPTALPYAPQTTPPASYATAATQPVVSAATTPATTSAAAPTVTPTSPVTTATSPASAVSNFFQTQPIALPVSPTATSAQEFLSLITGNAASGTATGTGSSLGSDIFTIVQGELATQTQSAATSVSSFAGTTNYAQQTLTMSDGQPLYFGAQASPLSGLFGALQNVLSNLLTYLRAL